MNNGVRDRSKEILRGELADAAAEYCAAHGFADSTVDEIARGIGISRATFFRYFASKEEAVVTAARLERRSIDSQLALLRAPSGSNALAAIRAALEPTVEAVRADPIRTRSRLGMIRSTPALRGRLAVDRASQCENLASALTEFIGDESVALAVAITAMGAIELGWSLWAEIPGEDIGDHFDRAFELVAGTANVSFD